MALLALNAGLFVLGYSLLLRAVHESRVNKKALQEFTVLVHHFRRRKR